MKPDMAPFPGISGVVSQMVEWPKKNWNAECHKEKEIVDTNLSTRQMPQDTCCRAIVCACSSITHLSNMQTRNHQQARFACSKLPRMLCMVVMLAKNVQT